jgi:hypothetical protein
MLAFMLRTCLVVTLFSACGESSSPPADDPPTVLAAIAATTGWMDDFVWLDRNWTTCQNCDHLITYDVTEATLGYHVFERDAGQPATLAEHCEGTQLMTESVIAGFDPRDRTLIHFEARAADNSCGFGTSVGDYVYAVITRDADGAPEYVANWLAGDDPAADFPGYDYAANGQLAVPSRRCDTAPEAPCEPTCDLTTLAPGGSCSSLPLPD